MSRPLFPTTHSLSVSELNGLARSTLEAAFPLLWVHGEVSNFVRASSGHWYFSLKDARAQIRCTCFRTRNMLLEWTPKNGDSVELRAFVTLYEARGEFQISVEEIRRAGFGALFEAFEALKVRLQKQGVFDAATKRPLPKIPRTIGIVTSLAAAALRDVLATLKRRMPSAEIVIYPTPVQGIEAASGIVAAIERARHHACCDVLILCRGGGSIEDLWPFNEEIVAHAIFRCTIPIVSGVGHETDFTISDFAADLRAATPTAAAEIATQYRQELCAQLVTLDRRLDQAMSRILRDHAQRVDGLARRLSDPRSNLALQQDRLEAMKIRLKRALHSRLERTHWRLKQNARQLAWHRPRTEQARASLAAIDRQLRRALLDRIASKRANVERLDASLRSLNPDHVLMRGYSIVYTASGAIVNDSAALQKDERLSIRFARGNAAVRVEQRVTVENPPRSD